MQYHPNELFLVCNPHSNIGKQTRAIAHDICKHINEVDVTHEKISPTYWKEIVSIAGVHPDELLDHSHPDYRSMISTHSYTMDGWLEVLVHDGHLVMYPIVIFNGTAIVCHTPTDILKLKRKSEPKLPPHLKDAH